MQPAWIGVAICLVAWIVLAFVLAIPSGWVHVPLAAGAILVAVGIAGGEPQRE